MGKYIHNKGDLSLSKLIENTKNLKDFWKVGALAIFIGVVRGETHSGGKVQKLEIEAYEEKAEEVIADICEDLMKKTGIVDVQIHHFVGNFGVGEDLVYVLVAGSHRENVFPVLKEAVERYKREAPIFKKEFIMGGDGGLGAYWVSEKEYM